MTLKFEDIRIDKEFEELLPKLTLDEFDNLENNILENGILDPLKLWREPETGKLILIDGHNRYNIIKKNKLEFDIRDGFTIIHESKLSNREDVKEWMLEQQLGRRNLTEYERHELVQKFKDLIQNKAKENQSLGGKGISNLSKVNTRKVLADKARMSEGTYYKLDKIDESGNKKVIQQLRDKKISVDKAYKEVQKPKKEIPLTPMQSIEQIDNRMNEIDREISSLHTEKQALIRKRTILFEGLDISCELKYEFTTEDIFSRECSFYIEVDGHKQVFVTCGVYNDEEPFSSYTSKVPDKYKNDFKMLYRKAHFEEVEYCRRKFSEFGSRKSVSMGSKADKEFYKKCFHILAKKFHPDNGEGNSEDMQSLNQLKQTWGV